MKVGVDLLKKNRHRAAQFVFMPLVTLTAILYVQMLTVPSLTKVALDSMILALFVVHVDLKDGGLLSRISYSFSSSYELRGYVTVAFAFLWATAFVVLSGGWTGPLLVVYVVPIALAAVRGGLRATLIWASVLGLAVAASVAGKGGAMTAGRLAVIATPLFVALVCGTMIGRLRRAAMDLSALYETGKAIGASLKLEETLPVVLNIVAMDLRAEVSLLVLVDDSTGSSRIEAQRGLPPEVSGLPLPPDDFIVDYVIGEMHSVCINQRYEEPVLSIAPEFGSVLAVPLVVGGKAVGALVAGNYEEHAFNRDSIRFMEALASQAATAVENGRLFGQAHQWAVRDGLTGLYNYRHFAERVADELGRARRYGGTVSIIMIDVDLFKKVNDTWGHLEGDEVLRQVAQLLQRETRESDVVARYGGEEFSIILPQSSLDQAVATAHKLSETIEKHEFRAVETDDVIHITISCGVGCYPETARQDEELLRLADAALYEAKTHRNCVRAAVSDREGAEATQTDAEPSEGAAGAEVDRQAVGS